MTDIVLVPGSYHGGWYYSPIVSALQQAGHRVFAVTPTGLGDRRHLRGTAINLDTHIDDVTNLFEIENIRDAVLVGHSYGGMIITGVSSRLLGRIRSLVYLDAMVPQNGQSLWDLLTVPFKDAFLGGTVDGLTTTPPPELDKRTVAHPLATFFQPLRFQAPPFEVPQRTYVWAEGSGFDLFRQFYDRLGGTEGWEVHRVPYGHDLMVEAPDFVRDVVIAAAEGRKYAGPPSRSAQTDSEITLRD